MSSRTLGAMKKPSHFTLITVFPCYEGLFAEEMEQVDFTSISWDVHGVTQHLKPFLSVPSSGKGCHSEDKIYLQIN